MSIKDIIFKQLKETKEDVKVVNEAVKQVNKNLNEVGYALYVDNRNPEEIKHCVVTIHYNPITNQAAVVDERQFISKVEAFEQMKVDIAKQVFND